MFPTCTSLKKHYISWMLCVKLLIWKIRLFSILKIAFIFFTPIFHVPVIANVIWIWTMLENPSGHRLWTMTTKTWNVSDNMEEDDDWMQEEDDEWVPTAEGR